MSCLWLGGQVEVVQLEFGVNSAVDWSFPCGSLGTGHVSCYAFLVGLFQFLWVLANFYCRHQGPLEGRRLGVAERGGGRHRCRGQCFAKVWPL